MRGLVFAALAAGVLAQPIALVDGVTTQRVFTPRNSQGFFAFNWTGSGSTDTATVAVEAVSGVPNVYISLNVPAWAPFPGPGSSVQPYQVAYDSGVIVLRWDDAVAAGCTTGVYCPVAITVFASTSIGYTVTAASDTTTQALAGGVPESGYVANKGYAYYSFTTSKPLSGLQIVLTQYAGDADIFVSTVNPQPTWSNFTWYAVGLGDEFISIAANSPSWKPAPTTYYIGVYGFTNATYTVMAFETAGSPVVTLLDGSPQAGTTSGGHRFMYYNYTTVGDASAITPVDVFVSENTGTVDIYVSMYSNVLPSVICATPSPGGPGNCAEWEVDPNTYTYTSTSSQQADFLTIPASALQPSTTFIVGILATTPDQNGVMAPASTFDVTVSSGNVMTELQNGVPVQGMVGANAYKNYVFQTQAWGNDVVVSTLMASGAVDIFVSERPYPTAGNSTWNTTNGGGLSGADVVTIPFYSLSARCRGNILKGVPCTLYASVLGWKGMAPPSAALYSLTAAISGSFYFPVRLSEGRLDRRTIPAHTYQYYLCSVNITYGESLYAIAQDYTGSSMIYANIGNSSRTFPSPLNNFAADTTSTDLGGYAIVTFSPPASSTGVAAAAAARTTGGSSAGANNHRLQRVVPAVSLPLVDGGRAVRTLTMAVDEAFLTRYHPEALQTSLQAAAAAATITGGGAPTDMTVGAGGAPYCTSNCYIYLTVAAIGTVASDVAVYYTAGATYTQLQAGSQPLAAALVKGETQYYTVSVQDPLDDLTITLTQTFGAVTAYVVVQSATRPYQTPGAAFWQWQLRPWTGSQSKFIPHSDGGFCKSPDSTTSAAPCTFVIAVTPRFATAQTATYTISASVNSSLIITPLNDGAPISASVQEGAYTYFSFAASTDGSTVVSPVLLDAEVFEGAVQVFVTNDYIAGVSPSTMLPAAGNTAVCQWTSPFTTIYINNTQPCFKVGRQVYTIGVLGASGYAGFTSSFTMTGTDDPFLIRQLEYGVPRVNQHLRPYMNANYSFVLVDGTTDILITATSTAGNVAIMAAFYDPANPVLPNCFLPAAGAQLVCTGYTWMGFGHNDDNGVGSTAFLIPYNNPCLAYPGYGMPAPIVNQTTCGTWIPGGRIAVVVYAFTEASYSVGVQIPGTTMELADGQPQLIMTTPTVFCPQRDNSTGQCTGASSTWSTASATFITFTVPANEPQVDQYALMERICPGMVDGNCGNNLQLYASACPANSCSPMDQFPYWNYNVAGAVVRDAMGSLSMPSCYANGGGNLGAQPCVYTVGVFPVCSNPQTNPPGVGCTNNLVRATWQGLTGIERIPSDCFTLGATCSMPAEDLGTEANAVRRYEAYAGDLPTKTTIQITACAGDVAVSLCTWGTGSSCNPATMPGPNNFDYQATTRGSNTGTAYFQKALVGGFFLGIFADPQTHVPNPNFQIVMSSGSGQILALPQSAVTPVVTRDPTGTIVTVGWQQAILIASGQQQIVANNALYLIYAFPLTLSPNYNLEAACGVTAAYAAAQTPIVMNSTLGTYTTLSGLQPSGTYKIAVTVYCPPGSCLTQETDGQELAYVPAISGPYSPSASPSPNPQPPAAPASPSNAGPVVGGIFGTILIVGVIGIVVWVFVMKRALPAWTNPMNWFRRSTGPSYSQMSSHLRESDIDAYATGRVAAGTDDSTGGGGGYAAL